MKCMMFFTAVLSLASCASLRDSEGTKQIETLCVSATTAVEALTPHRNELSAQQQAAVSQALMTLQPVCGQGENPPTHDTVKMEAIRLAQAKLAELAAQYGGTP